MPVKKGRLKSEDDYKIRKNYQTLMEDFDPRDGAIDHMISAMVFDLQDRERILEDGEQTQRGRAGRFIQTLERAGQEAYGHFLTALRETGNDHTADTLEATPVPEDARQDPQSWIEELPSQVQSLQLSAADASQLSAAFGHGYNHIFMALGFTKAKIEQEQMSNSHSPSVIITNLLIKWVQKNAAQAQWIVLLRALKKVQGQCTIEWETVHSIVKEKTAG